MQRPHARPKKAPAAGLSRAEFDYLSAQVHRLSQILEAQIAEIRRNRHDHDVSLQRMPQLQADLDDLKALWKRPMTKKPLR